MQFSYSFCFAALALIVSNGRFAGAAEPPRDIFVDAVHGDDRANGLAREANGTVGPFRSIRPAVRMARAGDTIHLAPQAEPYRDIAVLHDLRGEPGRPITLDGHGATLTGCDPLNPADWQEVSPGLYRNDHLLSERLLAHAEPIVSRWFFLFDGRINHMGRTRKGKNLPFMKAEDLQPGEWTYQAADHAFYIKIDPARQLADYRIEVPLRSDGVQISGDCAHLVIRNLTATHAYNDGYGLHGKTREVRFENIAAIECGDDGFSAHDDCQVAIDGFVSIGNTSGLANTGASESTNNRLVLDGNLGTDLLFLGSGVHTLTNSVVRCCGTYSLRIWGGDGFENVCTLKLENVLLERGGDTSLMKLYHNGAIEADHTTILGLGFQADGRSLKLHHSVIAGDPPPEILLSPASEWTADHNVYALGDLRIGNTSYDGSNFAAYQRATGQDASSRWVSTIALPLAGVGADVSKLPKRP